MEIERKFLIQECPYQLDTLTYHEIEQAYLTTDPVLRIRRLDDTYLFTYKSAGLLSREEYEAPLTKKAYDSLLTKCEGTILTKTRYQIPIEHHLTIELDVFHGAYEGLILAEVEFSSVEEANSYKAPDWFSREVTYEATYHNSNLCRVSPDTVSFQ